MSPCQLWQVESVTFLRDMIVIAKAADAAWKNGQHGSSHQGRWVGFADVFSLR